MNKAAKLSLQGFLLLYGLDLGTAISDASQGCIENPTSAERGTSLKVGLPGLSLRPG